jgi:hypothetical protein
VRTVRLKAGGGAAQSIWRAARPVYRESIVMVAGSAGVGAEPGGLAGGGKGAGIGALEGGSGGFVFGVRGYGRDLPVDAH